MNGTTTRWRLGVLAAVVGLGLDEHGVHAHVRLQAGGERLQILCGADLAAGDDPRVVGHVLRLERRHPQAAAREQPAQPGHQQALAHRRRRPLHHQDGG